MSNNLRGTKTAENLLKSFAGESQARMRYDYYASVANKEGYVQIANIFDETARNEKEHAKRFFKFLNNDLKGDAVEITATYPVHLGSTLENLKSAASGENEEHTELYPEFARVAEEEGFHDIAMVYKKIAEVEARHETRFNKLAENIEKNRVFEREEETEWICANCGYVHKGKNAPEKCPACEHPKGFFGLFVESY